MSTLIPRIDADRFAMPSLRIPKVICRRCKKSVESATIKKSSPYSAELEVRCHGLKEILKVATLNPYLPAYSPEIYAFQPASQRGKAVRGFLSAKRNRWRHPPKTP